MRQETKAHFLFGTVILGFLYILKKSQASSPLKYWIPRSSRVIKVMWFPLSRRGRELWLSLGSPQGIQTSLHLVRWNTSLNLRNCQGNTAFFWVRVSRGPFHLRQETQGPSYIPIAEGKLHLRCWWKVGSNLQSKTGNQLSAWDDMGCMELSSSCCTDINIHIDLRRVSQGISVDSSRKSGHLYCMLWNTG